MKHLIRLLACSAILAALAITAFPQGNTDGTSTAATQDDEREAARIKDYTDYYNLVAAKDTNAAYDKGKQFVEKYPTPDDQYLKAIKAFLVKIDTAREKERLNKARQDTFADVAVHHRRAQGDGPTPPHRPPAARDGE